MRSAFRYGLSSRATDSGPCIRQESFEFLELYDLTDREIKEHPSFPLDQLEALYGVAQPPPPLPPLPTTLPKPQLPLPPARPPVAGTGPATLPPNQVCLYLRQSMSAVLFMPCFLPLSRLGSEFVYVCTIVCGVEWCLLVFVS